MKPDKLFQRWQSRLEGFQPDLKKEWALCRRTGEVESIHRLRVLLRRARLYLRLGNPILGKEKVENFRVWTTRVSNAVGRVRDYDVTLAWLQQQPGSLPVYQRLSKRRAMLWTAARPKLQRCRELPLQALAGKPLKRQPKKRLASRFHKIIAGARTEVLEFNSPLDPADTEHWHELRHDLRRLRYLRELYLSPKQQKADRLLQSVIQLQEFLGEAQNCVAAATVLPKSEAVPEVKRLRDLLSAQRAEWLRKAELALKEFQKSQALKKVK